LHLTLWELALNTIGCRTNQTTLENISEFIHLRHLPPLPPSPTGQKLSNPPLEHELTLQQRRLVRRAHGSIRLYDVGFRKNWAQVFGWNRKWGWVHRLAYGGAGYVPPLQVSREAHAGYRQGDGLKFPHNPRSDEMLARLAKELVNMDTES
jgi:palmitoyltransferase ZDHHC2/15/20